MAQEDKELLQFKKRLHELAERSYTQGIYTFTGFMSLAEQDIYRTEERAISSNGSSLYGGAPDCDRVMARFGSEETLGYVVDFPIVCIHIYPVIEKFAEPISHRDYLGALMNLGIDRSLLGDIKTGERDAYLFCQEQIAEFICENLDQVRHNHVRCEVTAVPDSFLEPVIEPVTIQVAGMRLDAIISKLYHLSREKSLVLFTLGKVYVDGRLCENNAKMMKGTEAVSVRGFGKFVLMGEPKETKKGKLSVTAGIYK